MTTANFQTNLFQFRQALEDCRSLYHSSGELVATRYPEMIQNQPEQFMRLMDDLHKGLLIKLYVTIAEADRTWSYEERCLADLLFQHIWRQQLNDDQLQTAALHVSQQAANLKWYSLIRPFDRIPPLRERISELETVIVRLGNLVAKVDGQPTRSEIDTLRSIQQELMSHLHPIPVEDDQPHETQQAAGAQAIQKIKVESREVRDKCDLPKPDERKLLRVESPADKPLDESLEELDRLIGLDGVKREVRTLINFLELQKQREELGLPQTNISLHMVFAGNPGTGKTTVARIIGQLYGAMGILKKGQLIETDRAGLVAEYAGQTGPKANKKIDDALDGVLFVDEAYSLVAEKGDDPYGREAIQTLLKRMEDDRDRLVVILAGYPEPIERLLKSNPGLSSRFTHHLEFEDYAPSQLGRIFGLMCDKNQYEVPAETQAKLLIGFKWLYDNRDEHFGNDRTVRPLPKCSSRWSYSHLKPISNFA